MNVYVKYFKVVALIWTASLLLGGAFYGFVVIPQNQKSKTMTRKAAEIANKYNDAQIAAGQDVQKKLQDEITHLRQKLDKYAVDFMDSARITFAISELAEKYELKNSKIQSVQGKVAEKIPNCTNICQSGINLSFTSGFYEFAKMLNNLERNSPVVFVDRFSITKSPNENAGNQASMTLSVFVYKPEQVY